MFESLVASLQSLQGFPAYALVFGILVGSGFGLQGYGAHSGDAEYVLVDSIEPRLYLVTRLIMDISRGVLKR